MTAYRALVERGGDGWRVRLGNVELPARDLADVEPRCRRFLAETWGEAADGATIDSLPGSVVFRDEGGPSGSAISRWVRSGGLDGLGRW